MADRKGANSMKTKFRTWYDTSIEEVEVIRETEKFVTEADGQRWAKRNADFRNYFDSWEEAHKFLIDREMAAIKNLTNQIDRHQATLQKLQEMSQP